MMTHKDKQFYKDVTAPDAVGLRPTPHDSLCPVNTGLFGISSVRTYVRVI